MAEPNKDREVFVCTFVASAINKAEGTDYSAVSGTSEPADVILVSGSRRFPAITLQVVSAPADGTIRYDNKNLRKFERLLRHALEQRGTACLRVSVHWSKSSIQHGLKPPLIDRLADVIAANINGKSDVFLRGAELYEYSPELSHAVGYVSLFRLPYSALDVHSTSSWWSPTDGAWIEEAVRRKVRRYGSAEAVKDLLLVIDGMAMVGAEQINAFRAAHNADELPFREIWVVNIDGAHRVKP